MIDRVTLLARWAHHLAHDEPVAKLQPSLGLSSAALSRVMVEAIKSRNPDEQSAPRANSSTLPSGM
jgi:hypothetical protein